jgi:hypothetical protein
MTPTAILITGKASTIHKQLVEIIERWDGRYIPPADEYGFSLHKHKPVAVPPTAPEAGRASTPADTRPGLHKFNGEDER